MNSNKVRFIINNKLQNDFLDFYAAVSHKKYLLTGKNFYHSTKSSHVNSHEIDNVMDLFFEKRMIRLENFFNE